ncbi:hypothetical protein [Noviherbaspirillum malthae]|uniref:hypothetical protein n=1 Tax=Noviherbaspirillum malthae TaxID=1260987 RepID=UPI00188F184C|nr:hypothetical protein [Noviherbaspirillum malthae]
MNQAPAPRAVYRGTNLGFGFPDDRCFFSVERAGEEYRWSISETLAHFDEFSEKAQAQILVDCAVQKTYPGRDVGA